MKLAEQLQYVQLGAGGLTWLIFIAGLLWCTFSWWRASRCRRSITSIIFTITPALAIIAMIIFIALTFTRLINPRILDDNFMETLYLGGMILISLCWAASALTFFMAAHTNGDDKPPSRSI